MRPHQLAILSAAVGAFVATSPAASATAHASRSTPRPAAGAQDTARGADTTAAGRRSRRVTAKRRVRASATQPQRRDTVTVVRVDTVRLRDTVTVDRPIPAPPQRVDTVRIVEPRGRRRP